MLMGPNTYVPISWFCKKQGSISNSSTESELISLDAALRMEGIPALALWELIIDVFHPIDPCQNERIKPFPNSQNEGIKSFPKPKTIYEELTSVDYVPTNLPAPNGRAILVLLEDNDPVIQICIKGRTPTLRHVPRVHRVNTDACYERIREDPGIYMRYWPTKYQLADILTKGSFTKTEWDRLVDLLQIRPAKYKNKQEKDAQARLTQASSLFGETDLDETCSANIPVTLTKSTKHKGNKKRGKGVRDPEVGGINSY